MNTATAGLTIRSVIPNLGSIPRRIGYHPEQTFSPTRLRELHAIHTA